MNCELSSAVDASDFQLTINYRQSTKMKRACPLKTETWTRPRLIKSAMSSTDQHGFRNFAILAMHLLQNDRVPGVISLISGNIMFPGPAAKPQFFNEIHVRKCAYADHDSTLQSHPARILADEERFCRTFGSDGNIATTK
jgi:hypothetical protein